MGVKGRRSKDKFKDTAANRIDSLRQTTLHKSLCEVGAKWLLNVKSWKFRCNYVITEFVSMCSEQPDVLGYKGGAKTILIEVKTSRSDFLADKNKDHRKKGGLGLFKYYLCPSGLITIDELPANWGLLYANDTMKIDVIKESELFDNRDYVSEMEVMYSIIRRLSGKRQVFDFCKTEDALKVCNFRHL